LIVPLPLAGQRHYSPDDWVRKCRDWDSDRDERHCEVREFTMRAGALRIDAHPNGGIDVLGWDRSDIRIVARIQAHARDLEDAEALAKEIRIEARVPGRITDATFEPSASSRPVWADLPAAFDLASSGDGATTRVANLVPDRILQLNIRYNAAKSEAKPHAYAVFDGKPAQYMSDVGLAARYTAWSAFLPALLTFGGGLLLTIVVAGALVLWRNREFAEQLRRFVEAVLRASFSGLFGL